MTTSTDLNSGESFSPKELKRIEKVSFGVFSPEMLVKWSAAKVDPEVDMSPSPL